MYKEITDKCLIVFNSYKELNLDKAQDAFQESFQKRYKKKVNLKIVQLREPTGIRGDLTGYLSAYKRLKKKLTQKEINSFDTIVFIHDAGLATRLFPLSYEHGTPLKSTVRFPRGRAIDLLFECIGKSAPLLKNSVLILPVDHYFHYNYINIQELSSSLKKYSISMLVTPVPAKRVLGSLGVVKVGKNNKIERFYEKPSNKSLIPLYTKNKVLANTFQLITTRKHLDKLQRAIDLFISQPENKGFIKKLNNTEWSFNKLICESLTLNHKELTDVQLAIKKCLSKFNITLGGVIAYGYWEDWSSNIKTYINLIRKIVKDNEKTAGNDNYFIGSKKILASGKLKSCIFIDCDTIDLFGDFENCIFINCKLLRAIGSQPIKNALFYSLKKCNFLRKNMSNYVYARFISGRRHVEFECEADTTFKELYKTMTKISNDWIKYHEVIEKPS